MVVPPALQPYLGGRTFIPFTNSLKRKGDKIIKVPIQVPAKSWVPPRERHADNATKAGEKEKVGVKEKNKNAPSLPSRPPWDAAHHTPAGRAVRSTRAWGELTQIVRAASKASRDVVCCGARQDLASFHSEESHRHVVAALPRR